MGDYRRVLSAGSLTGDKVRNIRGEDIGKVEDIMLDLMPWKVAYFVLSFGGFLGMGEKLFAVPSRCVTVDEANKCVVMNIPKEKLESASGFDKNNWPDMTDPNWVEVNERYYD